MRHLTLSEHLSAALTQLSAGEYQYADRLLEGAVVVVGANGFGAEIAEDLHLAGRRVHLFTQPCRPLFRAHGLSGLGIGAGIGIGALVRRGLRLYGALLSTEGGRMIAAPGLYRPTSPTQCSNLPPSESGSRPATGSMTTQSWVRAAR